MPRIIVPIDSGWSFKAVGEDDSHRLPVNQFPTNIHLDLLAHKKIPNPSVGKNELLVQWVGERQWVYRTTFLTPHTTDNPTEKTVLAFDGLDTFATVVLNGKTILESDNMFLPHRVDVTAEITSAGGSNELTITFDNASLRGWKRIDEHPHHKWGCWNGDNSRLAVRKAQYHWGWDWGPTLLTCGPWRPIYLEVYESRISDLSFRTEVDKSLKVATVTTQAEIEAGPNVPEAVRFDVTLGDSLVASETILVDSALKIASASFRINNPALWYPVRYGQQPLYTVKATLLARTDKQLKDVDTTTKKIGLRRAELVQQPLHGQTGTSFFFRINNISIFCGGSNWIPADNFLPRVTPQRYHDWVKLVADGNQFMIRVWGGGIYEQQAFYDTCDELGVLVWQDFMFGCGNYPAWPAFCDSIRREAEANVRLLRHHPSIVIWAGNNEDYQYQESEGLTYDYANKDAESWLQTDFPARYIYEKILADVCAALIPDTYYHFGSPWGGGVDTHDPTVGDIHQWNVWHGTQEKYQDFDKLVGRFVSEFGMEAFPSVRTIDAFLPQGRNDPDRYAQSSTIDFHNKAAGHERRIALYLVENLRYAPDPLEQFVYCTQLMQAECLASAYRLWKRQWKGPGQEYCGGALVWQINDCWPVTSWSICDYYLRPKHAYYAVKREMAPVSVGMARREHVHMGGRHSRIETRRETKIEIWGSNLALEDLTVDCIMRAWDVETGEQTYEHVVAHGITLLKNRSIEIAELDVPVRKAGDETRTVVAAYLVTAGMEGADGRQLARYVNWPEPLKYLHLARPQQLVVKLAECGTSVALSAEVPVKGLVVEGPDKEADDVVFDDNLVDVVPGETVHIGVHGARRDMLFRARYLGMTA
ncbi:beta-mannosidase precursor [Grosmannia clavigera kw1407]|uniref:Beta-mannosidase B n=1 Tax=Grosmannia clavigera (strain kw1407 / UAMH 11150) TaxID=655863 RepID=F0X9Z9_GROCL|nr:beta-mannosidase precursor [Grosmannia clavigera kw1407]EFX05384.1 beta-mannosidase precursor [Grosmannia clavigera kw1407]